MDPMANAWMRATVAMSGVAMFGAVLPLPVVSVVSTVSAEPAVATAPVGTDWLADVNAYREMSGLPPVAEDLASSAAAAKHSCYMLRNEMSHKEIPGRPGYTPEGAAAGDKSNVAVHSSLGVPDREFVDLWMTGPFHAIGILRHDLTEVGYGRCEDAAAPQWHTAASLDVMTDRHGATATAPVLFPGAGSTTYLTEFRAETPDPRSFCGWPTGSADVVGLPTLALMPEDVGVGVTGSITGPNGPLEVCVLTEHNTGPLRTTDAPEILGDGNAVVVMPRTPLVDGIHTVTVTTAARTESWSFTVDRDAPLGIPAATATPAPTSVGFEPMSPVRLVNTMTSVGTTRLTGWEVREIQIAGREGVPAGAAAVSANVTAVVERGYGYLTVWPCDAPQPNASTLNFTAPAIVANAATVQLDPAGRVCVMSTADTHLMIDVNGAYVAGASARFAPVGPNRVMDTRKGLGGSGTLPSRGRAVLAIAGTAGVPVGARSVVLNVTSTNAVGATGFVTAYPCDRPVPIVSNLNPERGRDRANLVVVPLAADGSVCFFSERPVDLVVDVTGYLADDAPATFTASTPFRFVDTRDHVRAEVNAGSRGLSLQGGREIEVPIAGRRGVPAGVTGVSVNVTITQPVGGGYLTAWPCGERPVASTANFARGDTVANAAHLPLSASGSLCLFSTTTAHVVIDVNGWWS
ncbi:MAG: CAP domain-containing protein [Acidimicrobiales bacterium]|nr:CAP domain-containing protein [Acidimicrobiales bacterium]MCB9394882.1 CAP domain-containing protein [Acidimicrobiaceae bacterium]